MMALLAKSVVTVQHQVIEQVSRLLMIRTLCRSTASRINKQMCEVKERVKHLDYITDL
jgi:hypothetical protein